MTKAIGVEKGLLDLHSHIVVHHIPGLPQLATPFFLFTEDVAGLEIVWALMQPQL